MTSRNCLAALFTAAVLIVAGMGVSAGPAMAAQADLDLLKSYIGNWKGRGTTTSGSGEETVVCRLDITGADQGKVNYNGRCALAGGNLSIAGTMAYVEENRRFEAVMTSNTSFSGVAVGRRRGQGIDFNLKNRDADSGAEYSVDAGISLTGGNIHIDFTVTNLENGSKVVAAVPFEK